MTDKTFINTKICENCFFYDDITFSCHRYPPNDEFPKVRKFDWCGEFRCSFKYISQKD
uniref:Uncharacterized protein n=1 Tax=viral metagenome TaxID=1070528 RepID=A0A6C0JTX4_9ZZZZ